MTDRYGKYQVQRQLGRGGMAEVYEGVHPDLGRRVAIKVMLPQLAMQPGFEERFRREARLVASLRHAHIVQLYDFDIVDERPFMVMEYLEGGTLEGMLAEARKSGRPLPLTETARILDAIAGALDYAHAHGTVHRDIKPANILFTAQGAPVLSDFGIARLMEEAARLTSTGGIVGSPLYMSPEQAGGRPVDARSDIYALGVVLFEMVTGQVPFHAETPTAVLLKHLQEPPQPPGLLNPDLPEAVEAVVLRALAKEPQQRFAAAGEMALAFRAALGQGVVVSADAPTLVEPEVGGQRSEVGDQSSEVGGWKTGPRASDASGDTDNWQTGPQTGKQPDAQPDAPPQPHMALGWFTQAIDAVNVLAPLVGRQPQRAEQNREDRRARLMTMMGALAILIATLQLIVNLSNLVRLSDGQVRILPYVLAAVVIALVVLSIRTLRSPDAPVRRRRQAIAFLALIVLGALGYGGWNVSRSLDTPSGFVIAIADFDGSQASSQRDIARRIQEGLQREFQDLGDLAAIVRTGEVYASAAAARARGFERNASVVIWGWYDDGGVSPHVEVLRLPDLSQEVNNVQLLINRATGAFGARTAEAAAPTLADVSHYTRVPAAMPSLDLFVTHAGEQMTYVVATLLGVTLYVNESYETALALFDKAIAHAEAEGASALLGADKVYFHRAMTLFALGRIEEAIPDLESAIAIKPDLFEGHHNLALAYAQACTPGRQMERAVAEAEQAVRLKPEDAGARRLLGDLYYQTGRRAEAVAALQAAVDRDSGDALAYRLLGNARAALGEDDAATAAFAQALALQAADASAPDPVQQWIEQGDILVSASRYDEALAAYREALALAPDSVAARRGLGNAYLWRGDYVLAQEAYEDWARLAPADGEAWLLLGLLHMQTGATDQAMTALTQAAEALPCDPDAALLLAGLHFQDDDYEQAARYYEEALAIDPAETDAYYLLGNIYYLLGRLDEAAGTIQKAIDLRPDFAEAYRSLGIISRDQGDLEAAAAALTRLLELSPGDAAAYDLLAGVYLEMQRWPEAAAALEQVLAVEEDAINYTSLGQARLETGEYAEAIAAFERAIALAPDVWAIHQSLGYAYQRQGRWQESLVAFEQALALEETASTYFLIGLSHKSLGQVEPAIAAFERAAALEPQNWPAHYQLGELYAGLGDLPRAEAAYAAALALNDQGAEIHYGLGLVAYRQCSLSTAVQAMNRAVTLAPDFTGYRGLLGYLYEAQGRITDAEGMYEALRQAPVTDMIARLSLADHLLRAGALDAAAAEFQRVLGQDGTPPVLAALAYGGLGQVFYQEGKLLPAAAEFEQGLALNPAAANLQAGLGDVSLRQGDAAAALAAYEQALALLPQYRQFNPADQTTLLAAGIHLHRALALERLQDAEAAAAARDQAVALAEGIIAQAPRSPLGQFALGLAQQSRGEAERAEAAFAIAAQCDQTLQLARERVEADLVLLGASDQ